MERPEEKEKNNTAWMKETGGGREREGGRTARRDRARAVVS